MNRDEIFINIQNWTEEQKNDLEFLSNFEKEFQIGYKVLLKNCSPKIKYILKTIRKYSNILDKFPLYEFLQQIGEVDFSLKSKGLSVDLSKPENILVGYAGMNKQRALETVEKTKVVASLNAKKSSVKTTEKVC